MKTDRARRNLEAEKCDNISTENKIGKGLRRSLRPLQKAAGDKENLVGAGRLSKQMTPLKEVTITVSDSKVIRKTKTSRLGQKPIITEEDLTSEEGPSEGYWETLAERRRVALDAALKENEQLHQRIALLEEENVQCKLLLDETRHLVEALTEVVNEQTTGEETEETVEE